MNIYRIIQEALTNTWRHSRGRSVAIALELTGTRAVAWVSNVGDEQPDWTSHRVQGNAESSVCGASLPSRRPPDDDLSCGRHYGQSKLSARASPSLIETGRASVLIADDQTLFRSGLAALLDKDPRVTVVGQAANGEEAVRMVDEMKPDLVLMDLKMQGMEGVEATRLIHAKHPESP